jgi:quinol monooxygenase YgiN
MFGLILKIKTHPGQREALIEYLMKSATILRGVDTCYLYVYGEDVDDPDTAWVTEYWRSLPDHQAAHAQEALKTLIADARPLLAQPPEGFEVVPLGGKGIPDNG